MWFSIILGIEKWKTTRLWHHSSRTTFFGLKSPIIWENNFQTQTMRMTIMNTLWHLYLVRKLENVVVWFMFRLMNLDKKRLIVYWIKNENIWKNINFWNRERFELLFFFKTCIFKICLKIALTTCVLQSYYKIIDIDCSQRTKSFMTFPLPFPLQKQKKGPIQSHPHQTEMRAIRRILWPTFFLLAGNRDGGFCEEEHKYIPVSILIWK